jgi:hypothetical protein
MNARKHIAGFVIFSFILGSAILISNFLTIPDAVIPPVLSAEAPRMTIKRQQTPVTFRVRQVSLDYNSGKSYTELNLFRPLDQPAPDRVWVTTTFFSPDSTRAEDWSIITEIQRPFDNGNGEIYVAADHWELPPLMSRPGAGYFARVDVSSEYQGKFYDPDYHYSSDPRNAVPVVIHWPDDSTPARASKKFAR